MEETQILKLILDNSLIGYWDWNLVNDYSSFSQSFEQLLGYSSNEINSLGVKVFLKNTIIPEDYECSINAVREHFSSKGSNPYNIQERYIHKNGSIIWTNTRGQVIEWADDNTPVRMVGIHIDITKQKEQEIAVLKNNEVLNSVLNNIPQSVFWKDKNGIYLGCNKSFANLTGFQNPNDVIGKTNYDFTQLSPENIQKLNSDDYTVLTTNLPLYHYTEEINSIDYKKLVLDISKVPIHNEKKEVYSVLTITENITEKEQLKKELIKSNKLYNTLSKVHKLINNVSSKEELYNDVCKIITEVGEFKMALIGEPSGILIKPVAVSGIYIELAKKVRVTTDDSPEGNGPVGSAYKEGKKVIVNNFLSNKSTSPWMNEAILLDIKSIATFPLKCNEKIVGVLGVYSNQEDYFQSKEVDLLEEITLAIGSGLEKLETDIKQKKWEEEIVKSKEEWELTFDSIPDLIAILDTQRNILRTNKAMRQELNLSENDYTGHKCHAIMHGTDCVVEDCPYSLLLKDLEPHHTTRFEEKLNGYYNISTSPIFNKDGSLRGSVHISRNITEQKLTENKIRQFADIIEHSNAFIGIANMEGELTYLNSSNKRVFELDENADLSSIKITDYLTENALDTYYNHTIPETQKNGIWSGELEWKSKSSKNIPVILVVMLHRNESGEPEFTSATAIDISEIKKKETELQQYANDLRSLSGHLISVREEERRFIAKEIHDELGQNLTSIKMDVSWISTHLDSDRNKLNEHIDQLKNVTTETVQTSRRLYNSLYPQMLDEIGLIATITWHANNYLKPHNIDFDILSNMKEDDVFPDYHNLLLTIYRIYQESVTNILRYSQATFVTIELTYYKDVIELKVNDNGIGFEMDKVDFTQHHGLIGIRERVLSLNGTLNIMSRPGKGTYTTVSIPLNNIVSMNFGLSS